MTTGIATFESAELSRCRALELIGWLREYASNRINSRLIDERRCIPPYIILDFGNRGLMGMQVPESYGGLGLRHADHLRVLEQLGAIDLTLALVVFNHGVNGIRPIQGYATPAVRDEWLPRLASGREMAAFALSEPAAGVNVGRIASEARRDGDAGWRIRGLKRWNSSSWAGVISVFAREINERGRAGGLTGFVVRQGTPGLQIGPEALTMGMRGSVQNSLFLNDVAVAADHVLGQPGRGMEVAEDALSIGRLCIAAVCLGGLKRSAQLMARYAARRTVASGRLLENPLVLAALSEMALRIDVVEALKDQVARRLDAGLPVPPEICMAAKVVSSDSLNLAAGQVMQFLGGRGYMENNLASQILRDARLYSVGEGPNEPLTTQVGRKARLTDAIGAYLRADPAGAALAELLASSVTEVSHRCLDRAGPFADRSCAQLWADAMIGQVASDLLLLAAVREAQVLGPCEGRLRAIDWAEIRVARSLRRARDGDPEERLIPTAGVAAAIVAWYADSIGDIEQTLAGEEEALDVYLSKTRGSDPYAPLAGLPGQAVVTDDDESALAERPDVVPSPDESRRELPARMLLQPFNSAGVGSAESGPPRTPALGR
jgi:alkylation response protein AidB-like acyl-CoA dehydrogenase